RNKENLGVASRQRERTQELAGSQMGRIVGALDPCQRILPADRWWCGRRGAAATLDGSPPTHAHKSGPESATPGACWSTPSLRRVYWPRFRDLAPCCGVGVARLAFMGRHTGRHLEAAEP